MSKTALLNSLLEAAKQAKTKLTANERQWAPVHNSLLMIREIINDIDNTQQLTTRYNSGHLKVGLLAAKGFDGVTDKNILEYATLLYKVDSKLLDYLGIDPWGP